MGFANFRQPCRRLPVIVLVAAFGLGPNRATCAQDARSLKERFLTEAPNAWEEYRGFAARLSGTFTGQSTLIEVDGKRVLVSASKYEIKQIGDHRLFSLEQVEGSDTRGATVHATNPRYAFRLIRPKGKTDWILSQLDLKVLDGSTVDLDAVPLQERIHQHVARHFELEWLPLSPRIRQPNFKVVRASAVPRDGREFVRIDFTNEHSLPTRKKGPESVLDPVQSGWLLLDPEHYWCLVESEVVRNWGFSRGLGRRPHKSAYEYREGTNGFPILTRIISRLTPVPEKKEPGVDYVFEYDLRESPEPEEEEFTLTAYGLPEPVGMELPRRSRIWLWFTLGGVAVLALGFLFRQLARRRAAVQAAPARAAVTK